MAKLGRKRISKDDCVISLRLDPAVWQKLKDFAHLMSQYGHKVTSGQELIRMAIKWSFEDNERLRDLFRQQRELKFRSGPWIGKKRR